MMLNVCAHLGGQLDKEVVVCSEGANADTLADGRGQSFNLIETAVELIQGCQPEAETSRFNDMALLLQLQWITGEKV